MSFFCRQPLFTSALYLAFAATSLGLLSCASSPSLNESPGVREIQVVKSSGFANTNISQLVFLPLDGSIARSLSVEEIRSLEAALMREFSLKTNLEVLNLSEKELVRAEIAKLKSGPAELSARSLAAVFPGSASVVWRLTEYQAPAKVKSTGGRESVVGFKLTAYAMGDSNEYWTAHFRTSEQSLSENIFRIKEAVNRGMRFETQENLLRGGFAKVANRFNTETAALGKN